MKNPLEVECPRCGSERHEPCHAVTHLGFVHLNVLAKEPHVARIRASERGAHINEIASREEASHG